MANYVVSTGTLFEDFETLGDWTQDVGSATSDTSIYKTGTKSLKVTSATADVGRVTKTISSDLSRAGNMLVWVYLPTLTDVTSIQIIISSSTTFTNYFSISKSVGILHEGWNAINIAKTDWTNNSADDWANTMVRLRFAIYATANTPSAYFDSMYINTYQRPKCLFTFDDGIASALTTGRTTLNTYGFKATAYINQGYVGTGGSFATAAQIQAAFDDKWDIANHTVNHNHLNALTEAQQISELIDNETYIKAQGWSRNNSEKHWCYPFGEYNATTLSIASSYSCITATSTIERIQANYLDSQYLLTRRNLGNTNTLTTAKSYVDDAITKGGAVIFQMHKLVASPTTATEWDPTDFANLVAYVASKSEQIDVVTITEWYRGLTQSRKIV